MLRIKRNTRKKSDVTISLRIYVVVKVYEQFSLLVVSRRWVSTNGVQHILTDLSDVQRTLIVPLGCIWTVRLGVEHDLVVLPRT